MPIKKSALKPRLAEVGKIKIGGKGKEQTSKNGKKFRIPQKYDHFVITTTERDGNGNYIEDGTIMDALGGTPREIPVRFLFDDINMNFFTEFQFYSGRKLCCRGDGEVAVRTFQKAGKQTLPFEDGDNEIEVSEGQSVKIVCDPDTCPIFQDTKCKPSGILSAVIPQSMELGGVYRFRTHSWNSISSIMAALEFFASQTKGILTGLPLKLKMVKKTTEEHGTIDYVTVVLDGLELSEMRTKALEEFRNREQLGIEMLMIEQKARDMGFMEDTDEPEDVAEEYYPDAPPPRRKVKGVTASDLSDKLDEQVQDVETEPEPELVDDEDSVSEQEVLF